ncbi:agamous-like MADS-box protein AGL80 [Telopea speciosissima]|uniref:agamous-like MADS-box protein AGL80 n=1 Tax=Telopea speciosissima TaxID=54955 RepID=UPI001CC3F0E4|nr:agamous-like MADS-box protein AGL80 [Telopea speciosissima]
MARKKIELAFIANATARKNTFNKRKKGIMKKMSELSTLCGVKTCGIIYDPNRGQPEVWPSPLGAIEVINAFKSMPQTEQSKKMENHEEYLRKRIGKVTDQLRTVQKENRKKEMTMLMYECLKGKDLNDLTMPDLTDLTNVIDEKKKAINSRIEVLKQTRTQIGTSTTMAGAMSIENNKAVQVAMNDLQAQPWFMQRMNPNEQMPCFDNKFVPPYLDNGAFAAPFFP